MSILQAVRFAFIVLALGHTLSADVDCRDFKKWRVVCSNPELRALEDQLSPLYYEAVAEPGASRTKLESDQASWESAVLACGQKVECVKKLYLERIAALKAKTGESSKLATATSQDESRKGRSEVSVQRQQQRRLESSAETKRRLDEALGRLVEQTARRSESGIAEAKRQLNEALAELPEQERREWEDNPWVAKMRFDLAQDEQQAKAKAEAEASMAGAQSRFERLNGEKLSLMASLEGFKDMGPLPSLESTVPRVSRRRGASVDPAALQEASDKIEQQLPLLRAEVAKRQEQAVAYAQQVLRKSTFRNAANVELESLIGSSGSADGGALKAYLAARKLDSELRAFALAKQRAEKVAASVRADLASAAKVSGDAEIAAATQNVSQVLNELFAKAKTNDPGDEPQLSTLASKLEAQQATMNRLVRQKTVLASSTGRQVYQGCLVWAKRMGMGTSSGVRVFKDDSTNRKADLATNQGTHLCGCMAVEIAGDREMDEAKLEIANQFETRDRMDNQALAAVVAVAGGRCQLQMVDQLSGGQLSGRR